MSCFDPNEILADNKDCLSDTTEVKKTHPDEVQKINGDINYLTFAPQ